MSELVISYLFPPSMDVAGMALAKRYIAKNIKFDILQANYDDCDYEFLEYMNEYINDQIILDMKCNPNHTKCMEKFVNDGMSKIKDRKYDKITSVAWKVANHFLALEYKLEHPDTFWTAEFTDPISFDIYNKKREGGKRSTVTDADYIGKINREIEKVNLKNNTEFPLLDESANIYLLVEYIAFLFADQIRFTNIHQMDVMLKQFPCDMKSFVEKKSVIEDFPPLPSRFYEIKETSDLDNDYIEFMDDRRRGTISGLPRYSFKYSPEYVYEIMQGMSLEKVPFKAQEGFNPDRQFFITNDEINKLLSRGSSYAESRYRIYTFFVNHSDMQERIKMIKEEYGTGGYSAGNDNANYDGKGLFFSHGSGMEPYAKVLLKWNDVVKRVDALIKADKFLSDEDIAKLPDIEKEHIANDVERLENIKKNRRY